MNHPFTPKDSTGRRLNLMISTEDRKKFKHTPGWTATITDLLSGRVYEIKGVNCGLPECFCDAQIVREIVEIHQVKMVEAPGSDKPFQVWVNFVLYRSYKDQFSAERLVSSLKKDKYFKPLKKKGVRE